MNNQFAPANRQAILLSGLFLLIIIFSAYWLINRGRVAGEHDVSFPGVLIYNGESSAARASAIFTSASATTAAAHSGSYGFEGTADYYHAPQFSLANQPMYRKGITKFDELWFYIKSDSAGHSITLTIKDCCGRLSNTVSINKYALNGEITTDWQLIKIPLKDLQTATYPLENIQFFSFNAAPKNSSYKIYVDDMFAVDQTPEKIISYRFYSDNVIRLELSERYNFGDVINKSNYELTSAADNDFLSAANPQKIGREFFVSDFAGSGTTVNIYGNPEDPILKNYIYLVFEKPLKNGIAYSLKINNIKDNYGVNYSSPLTLTLNYNSQINTESIGGSVKTNQVGFLPISTKMAYAGNYLGDLGVLNINPSSCQVINSDTQAVAYTGTMSYRGTDLHIFGEKVYACDFSSLTAAGTYYIYVPGVGRSYDFRISDDIYNNPAYVMAKALYYQRSSIDLDQQYAGKWARPGGHKTLNAVIHESQRKSPLYNNEAIGSTINMPRGWYDAGDYGKYVISSAPTINEILDAYESFPEKFADKALNIPESGNGVPDILDEVKWELDWLKEMQAPDGGVFHKVTPVTYARIMPADDNSTFYISEKDTHSTAMYVASLAKGYRNLKPYFPEYADDLLARAKKSWQFLKNHPETVTFSASGCAVNPSGIGGGQNALCRKDNEERAWAAAELYKSTGEDQYNADFITYWKIKNSAFGENYTFPEDSQRKASFTYATTPHPTDSAIISAIKNAYTYEGANVFGKKAGAAIFSNNLYRSCVRQDLDVAIGWGQFAHSSQYSWQLIKEYLVTGNKSFLETAKLCFDTQLGANPQYLSYITGLGHDYPRRPFNTPSALDGIDDPVPGISVFGPFGHMPNSNPYYAAAQTSTNLYPLGNETPDPYPVTRRFYDARLVPMGEYTKLDMSYSLAAFHFFSTLGGKSCQPAWNCGDWGSCVGNSQNRSCVDANNCGSQVGRPAEQQDCAPKICSSNWQCSDWTACASQKQNRSCYDANNCGSTNGKPEESRGCGTASCQSNWQCGAWGACSGGNQTRYCSDANSCRPSTNIPSVKRACLTAKDDNSANQKAAAVKSTTTKTSAQADTTTASSATSEIISKTFFKGKLIKTSDSPAVYQLGADGKRRLFVNEATFWSWRTGPWSNQPVTTISQAEFDALPMGGNIAVRPGSKLVRFDNSPRVYAVAPGNRLCYTSAGYGEKWQDRIITIQSSFESDYTKSDSCKVAGADYKYPDATLIQYKNSNDIYYIDEGKKRLVRPSVFAANGFKKSDVISGVDPKMAYPLGSALTEWK